MAGKPYKRPTKAQLRALLARHSISEAAAVIGRDRSSIRLWGLQYGLIERERPYSYEIPSGRALRQLCGRYSDSELAAKYGCSEQTIRERRHTSEIFRS